MRLKIIILLSFICKVSHSQGQSASDIFQDKLYAYSLNHPSQTLFVHFDKNIYLNEENIWFASYLVNPANFKNEILSICLMDRATKKLIKTDEFLIVNQYSAGKISISDSLPSGKYDLVCLTDVLNNKKPVDIFIQPIEIINPRKNKDHRSQQRTAIPNKGENKKQVQFYPEGGYLIQTIPSRIGVQINDTDGTTRIDTSILLQNGQVIDRIVTDKNGMAVFNVPSAPDSRFSLRIIENGQYSDFDLPIAITSGVAIRIDTTGSANFINVHLTSTGKGKYSVIIHNYKETFGVYAANFTGQASTLLNVPVETLPVGLFTVTIIDDEGSPVAERVIFRKPPESPGIIISTPKIPIEKEQKVSVSIHPDFQKPLSGVFSIACINADRINYSSFRRIDSYEYLYHELNQVNSYPQDAAIAGAELEKLLLIKGWTRYKLNNLVHTDTGDTILKVDKIKYTGLVKKVLDGKPKTGATISVFRDSSVSFTVSDGAGQFKINNEDMVTESEGGKVKIIVNNDKNKEYSITLSNPLLTLQNAVIDSIYQFYLSVPEAQAAKPYIDTFFAGAAILDSVVVKSRPSNLNKSDYMRYNANACGDFICSEGILNCPVHKPEDPGSHKPVKGKDYPVFIIRDGRGVFKEMITYSGCLLEEGDKKVAVFQGIHALKDYYMPITPDKINRNSSTLHWESLKQLSGGEDYILEFNSGKVEGKYLIIIQGTLNNTPLYKEQTIIVQ